MRNIAAFGQGPVRTLYAVSSKEADTLLRAIKDSAARLPPSPRARREHRNPRSQSADAVLEVLHHRVAIASVQSRFIKTMRAGTTSLGLLRLGWQGGQAEREVYWHSALDVWMSFAELAEEGRYWSAFGVGNPADGQQSLPITVEINAPFAGINRRVGGAFARDSEGGLYLLHRGNVGGGRSGIGKNAFMSVYPGAITTIAENGISSKAIVIAQFGQPEFQANAAAFVSAVERFKRAPLAMLRQGSAPVTFKPEFEGKKTIQNVCSQIEAECRHGVIVNSLQRALGEYGYQCGNTQNIDLLVALDGRRKVFFEVKPAADRYSVYTAIGQLLFHSAQADIRVAVLPADCDAEVRRHLKQLNILVLAHSWHRTGVTFDDLESLLSRINKRP